MQVVLLVEQQLDLEVGVELEVEMDAELHVVPEVERQGGLEGEMDMQV